MDWEILYSFVVAGGGDKLAPWALWRFMPISKCVLPTISQFKLYHLHLQLQNDDDDDQVGGHDDHDRTTNLGFGSSKPGRRDKDGNLIMTVVDRSGIHEIGVSWCHCPGAPENDVQLMMAGLFPATFHKPKTALLCSDRAFVST